MLTIHYNLLAKYDKFKKRKDKNLLKPFKILGDFITFFLKHGDFFGNFARSSLD
jgi:hypothetical protein